MVKTISNATASSMETFLVHTATGRFPLTPMSFGTERSLTKPSRIGLGGIATTVACSCITAHTTWKCTSAGCTRTSVQLISFDCQLDLKFDVLFRFRFLVRIVRLVSTLRKNWIDIVIVSTWNSAMLQVRWKLIRSALQLLTPSLCPHSSIRYSVFPSLFFCKLRLVFGLYFSSSKCFRDICTFNWLWFCWNNQIICLARATWIATSKTILCFIFPISSFYRAF